VDVRKGEIAIKVVSWPSGKGRKYSAWHNLPTTDREKAQNNKYLQLFEIGRLYILDELADDIILIGRQINNFVPMVYCLLAFLAGKSECSAISLPKDSAASFQVGLR
jgi:hypothetical protein